MRKMNNKGQIDALQPLIIALVVIGIVLVVGFLIFAEVQDQIVDIDDVTEAAANTSTWSYGYNASQDITNAMADIPGWLPIIVVVVIGALLIGLVSFLRRQAR